MTLRNFQIGDELWDRFLRSIKGEYDNASEALRALIRKHVNEKEAS